MINVAMPVDW